MPLALRAPAPPCSALLAGTYQRLGALSALLRLEPGPPRTGGTRVTGRALAQDHAVLDRLVTAEERRIRTAYGTVPRRDVAATWVLHRYAFTACLAMSGPWYLERRVPRLPLDRVSWDWRDGGLTADPDGVSCLPGDPAVAGRPPGVRELPDEEALRAELRGAVAEHLGPVLEAFRPLLRRGSRTLWGMASDELTEGIWYLGRLLGDPGAAARDADLLLPGGTAPYAGSAGFRPSGNPGTPGDSGTAGTAAEPGGEPTRTRIGCCLYYTIRPDEVCATCPRTCPRTP